MPSTPPEVGAGALCFALETGRRVAERLARSVVRGTSVVRETTTGGATGLGLGLGLGLTTPLKPMFPNDGEIDGAFAADGATIARAPIAGGVVVFTPAVNGAAEAGRAKEATMPPDTAITAEALAAGFAEREIAADRDRAGFKRVGTR